MSITVPRQIGIVSRMTKMKSLVLIKKKKVQMTYNAMKMECNDIRREIETVFSFR